MHFSWRLRHLPFSLPHIYPKTQMTSCEIEHKLWFHSLTQFALLNLLFSHLPCYSFVTTIPFHNSFKNYEIVSFRLDVFEHNSQNKANNTMRIYFPKNVVGRFAPFCLSSPCAFKKMWVNKFWTKIFFPPFQASGPYRGPWSTSILATPSDGCQCHNLAGILQDPRLRHSLSWQG